MTTSDEHERSPEDRIEDWLRAHREATTETIDPDQAAVDGPSDPLAGPPAAVATWDPRTGSWVEEASPAPAPFAPQRRTRPKVPSGATPLRTLVTAAIVGAVVAAAVAFPVARWTAPDRPVTQQIADRLPTTRNGSSSIVDIASRARPWVVNVNVGTSETTAFGDVQVRGTGSGVILRSDGHILTNAHVVDGARSIEVTLASGDNLDAKVIGIDTETDIAVIKVNRNDLPAAVVGSVKDLQVGDTAVAIGSPLGLEQTVTAGIISALGRRVSRENQSPLVDMIQTDAPVTQGNSGGALVDGSGAVVGINAAIAASPEVGAEGIAFAIPIDVAVAVSEELINSGRATHPWLGVAGGNITEETAKEFGVEEGAFIREVVPNGPAAKGGLKVNDIVVELEGEKIESMDDLVVAIRGHNVGEVVDLTVVRNGQRIAVRATLEDKPDAQ